MPGYMRIDNEDDTTLMGDVLRKGKRWTRISSFSFEPVKSSLPSGAEKPDNAKTKISRTVYITLPLTPNTQALFRRAVTGTSLGDIYVELVSSDDKTSSGYQLVDAMIVSTQFGRTAPGGDQTQTLILNCSNVVHLPATN